MGLSPITLAWVVIAAGCSGDAGATGGEPTGSAVARITTVPGDVQCVRLTMRGATQSFGVTAAAPATLDLGPLAPGTMLVSAQAFDAMCADLVASTTPTWISDPASVSVAAGLTTSVPVTLRPNARASATLDFVSPARSVVTSPVGRSTYAVMQDGTVRAWGANEHGQLGQIAGSPHLTSAVVGGLVGVRQVAAGFHHACALREDGAVRCWGDNTYGQLGTGRTGGTTVAVGDANDVVGTLRFSQIVAGRDHTCGLAVGAQGLVYCWGYNGNGELGDGSVTDRSSPVAATLAEAALELTAGEELTCARVQSGHALCWGDNFFAQFGNGAFGSTTPQIRPTATQFVALQGITSGSDQTCGLEVNGTVRCTGYNFNGDIGDGTLLSRVTPTLVSSLYDATQVAAGSDETCARRSDGSVWCWGINEHGSLGAGSVDDQSLVPVQVLNLTGATQVTCGYHYCCARRDDGAVWCWGYNSDGELGDGTVGDRFTPVRVPL